MASEPATCKVCGAVIPAARLEAAPATVTCSRKCSRENLRMLNRAAVRRHRERKRGI